MYKCIYNVPSLKYFLIIRLSIKIILLKNTPGPPGTKFLAVNMIKNTFL